MEDTFAVNSSEFFGKNKGFLIDLLIGYIVPQLILTVVLLHMVIEEELETKEAKIFKPHGC